MGSIHKAFEAGMYSHVQGLLKAGIAANTTDDNGMTLLMKCARVPSTKVSILMTKMLLQYGGNVTMIDMDGRNALMHAVLAGRTRNVKVILTECDIDLRQSDNTWETALHLAANLEDHRITSLLTLAHNKVFVPLDLWNNEGLTPLMIACKFGNNLVAEVLVEGGASQTICDKSHFLSIQQWTQVGMEYKKQVRRKELFDSRVGIASARSKARSRSQNDNLTIHSYAAPQSRTVSVNSAISDKTPIRSYSTPSLTIIKNITSTKLQLDGNHLKLMSHSVSTKLYQNWMEEQAPKQMIDIKKYDSDMLKMFDMCTAQSSESYRPPAEKIIAERAEKRQRLVDDEKERTEKIKLMKALHLITPKSSKLRKLFRLKKSESAYFSEVQPNISEVQPNASSRIGLTSMRGYSRSESTGLDGASGSEIIYNRFRKTVRTLTGGSQSSRAFIQSAFGGKNVNFAKGQFQNVTDSESFSPTRKNVPSIPAVKKNIIGLRDKINDLHERGRIKGYVTQRMKTPGMSRISSVDKDMDHIATRCQSTEPYK